MRTKRFFYNSASSATLQVLTMLAGLILPRLYISTYGSGLNGLVSSISQFIYQFNYVEAGLGMSLVYALYKPLAKRDIPGINSIVSLAKKSYLKASGIHFLLVVCLATVYPFIIKREDIDIMTIVLLVLVIGIFGTLDFYTMAKYRVLLVADQKEYIISLASIMALVINFILTAILIINNTYIVIVRAVPLISFVLRSSMLFLYIKQNYPYIKYDQPSDPVHLKRRWDALIFQLSASLSLSVPVVIVAIFCSLKMASVYSVYFMVFTGLIAIISIFTAGVTASFGNLLAAKEIAVLEKVHIVYEFSIYGITAFLYSCTIILINPFISIYTRGITDINYVNYIYGVLFVIWGIIHNIRIPYSGLLTASGMYKEVRTINIMQVVILLSLSVILVRFFNIVGVLMAMIVATSCWSSNLILIAKRLLLRGSTLKTFQRILRMFLIVAISYTPFYFWIPITASTLYEWFIWAIGVAGWCCVINLLINFLLDREVFKDIVARLNSLLPKSI